MPIFHSTCPLSSQSTTSGHRMANRKWKETKQEPSMLPGPAVPDCSLLSFHFLWQSYVRRLYQEVTAKHFKLLHMILPQFVIRNLLFLRQRAAHILGRYFSSFPCLGNVEMAKDFPEMLKFDRERPNSHSFFHLPSPARACPSVRISPALASIQTAKHLRASEARRVVSQTPVAIQ